MNPFDQKPLPVLKTYESFPALYPRAYDPRETDPYTKCRIILMNGTEFEAVKFSHQMARHVENQDLRRELAMTRRTEQQQQKKLANLKPISETILEHTGVGRYFYKDAEKKEFDRKENYADCLLQYIACVDKDSGLYPLTEDLKYIIQNNGEHQGWWDPNGNYIFLDDAGNSVPGINNEIAWLFMCCYIAQ